VAGILDRHRHAAKIVLASIAKVRGKPTAEAPYGLAGGNALIAHRLSNRRTMDVDVAISQMLGDWKSIEAAIETGLSGNGYAVERAEKTAGLDVFADYGEELGLSKWEVQAPGADEVDQVQVSNFDLKAAPVIMPGIGPVLALDDVAGWKTVAFANRRMARDAYDMAELLTRFTVQQLIALALARDPGLQAADFADAGRYVGRARDDALAAVLDGTGRDVTWLRSQLKDWPRTAPPRQ
jgi:predicted nucleotidyltransferase component of viral defense system